MRTAIFVPLLVTSLTFTPLPAAQDKHTARTHLDVVVRDPRGHIARDLSASDFKLTENGVAVPVTGVKLVDGSQPREITLLFGPIQADVVPAIRAAAEDLISALRKSGIRVAVYQADETMALLQTFTTDQNALRSAINVATGKRRPSGTARSSSPVPPPGQGDHDVAAIAEQALTTAAKALAETGAPPPVAALIGIAREQEKLPGRKAVVYFSEGIPLANAEEERFRHLVSAANRASVSIYTVDADALAISDQEQKRRAASAVLANMDLQRGLAGPAAGAAQIDQEHPPGQAPDRSSPVLRALSQQTGGFSLASAATLRNDLKRIGEDLGGYYELTYQSPSRMDGKFLAVQVAVGRPKFSVQGRQGYFAVPELATGPALPFQVPLLDALDHPPDLPAFFHESAVLSFRSGTGDRPAQFITVGVRAGELRFQEDSSAGLMRGHLSVLAIVRDQAGKIVMDFGRDVPLLSSQDALVALKDRYLSYSGEFHLSPGSYILESVMRDEVSGQISTRRSAFTVEAITPQLGISSLCLVKEIVPISQVGLDNSPLQLGEKSIVPAVNGVVKGGTGARTSLFFSVYPSTDGKAPLSLHLDVLKNGEPVLGGPVTLKAESRGAPQILSVDVSTLESGPYDVRLVAVQGEHRVESRARMIVEGGIVAGGGPPASTTEETIRNASAAELTGVAPTVDQQRLLEEARRIVSHYYSRLPNFICTQVTRSMYDDKGKGQWHTTGEVTELLTFVDGQEHYSKLADRSTSQQRAAAPAVSLTSAGEFGTHLKRIFDPEFHARFGYLRQERFRGRLVQVFTYAVDGENSKYRIAFSGGQKYQPPVFSPYHGLVYVDYETGGVRKLTIETDPLPAGHPLRLVSCTLEYDDVSVAGKLYLLPLSAQLEVQLPRRQVVRNEITFRSYQRFGTSSRIVSVESSTK